MITADHMMIDRRILQEAESLIAHGHEVKLLAGFECEKVESYQLNGISIDRYQYDWSDTRADVLWGKFGRNRSSKGYAPFLRGYRRLMKAGAGLDSFEHYVFERAIEQSFDLVHVHDYPMLKPGLAVAKLRKVPIIYDSHEFYPHQVQFAPALQKKMLKAEQKSISDVNAVITVNEFIADEMAKAYSIPKPYVIYNAVPLADIEPKVGLRQELGLDSDAQLVLYQGWISPNRGVESLINMMVHLPNAHLVVVGYGDYLSQLQDMSVELDVAGRIHFMGRKEPDELQRITAACDLGVIPYTGVDLNNYYCSPNKLFEFTMAKLPFVCNDLPFLASVVTKYRCGETADLSDSAAAAHTIGDILGDPHRLADLAAGCESARAALNWTVEEQKMFAIYGEICEG